MPLLYTFAAESASLACVLPHKGAPDTPPQRMDRGIAEALPPALGGLPMPGGLWNGGEQAGMAKALPIAGGSAAAIEVAGGTAEGPSHLVGPLVQRSPALWEQA